jgi:hypothetical protein
MGGWGWGGDCDVEEFFCLLFAFIPTRLLRMNQRERGAWLDSAARVLLGLVSEWQGQEQQQLLQQCVCAPPAAVFRRVSFNTMT